MMAIKPEEDIKEIKKELTRLREKQEAKDHKKQKGTAFSLGVMLGYFLALLIYAPQIFSDKYVKNIKLNTI